MSNEINSSLTFTKTFLDFAVRGCFVLHYENNDKTFKNPLNDLEVESIT